MSTTALDDEDYTPAEGEMIADLVVRHTGHAPNDSDTTADGTRLRIAIAADDVAIPHARWVIIPVAGAIDIVTAIQGG